MSVTHYWKPVISESFLNLRNLIGFLNFLCDEKKNLRGFSHYV